MQVIQRVKQDQKELLQALARKSYSHNFGSHWTGPGLELYLEDQFGSVRLERDLNDVNIDYSFVMHEGNPVGFAKINRRAFHEDFENQRCAELEKLYLLEDYKRMGLGKKAMEQIIHHLSNLNINILFLCVIETNQKANAFYKAIGFEFLKKCRLDVPYFKDDLRVMDQLFIRI